MPMVHRASDRLLAMTVDLIMTGRHAAGMGQPVFVFAYVCVCVFMHVRLPV